MKSALVAAAAVAALAAPVHAGQILPNLYSHHLCSALAEGVALDDAIAYAVRSSLVSGPAMPKTASGLDLDVAIAIRTASSRCPGLLRAAYAQHKRQQPPVTPAAPAYFY